MRKFKREVLAQKRGGKRERKNLFFSLLAARKAAGMTKSCWMADTADNEKNTLCQEDWHRVKIGLLVWCGIHVRIKVSSH